MELLYWRSFVLYSNDEQTSRPFRTKNGVARGSVLLPCLYNIYTTDFPETSAKRCMYADDVALIDRFVLHIWESGTYFITRYVCC